MDCKIVMIGAGALGSHLLCNSLRTGFGQWTVVDNDDLFPHNIGRHVLNKEYIDVTKQLLYQNLDVQSYSLILK